MKLYKIIYVKNGIEKETGCTEYSLEKYKNALQEQEKEIVRIENVKKKYSSPKIRLNEK